MLVFVVTAHVAAVIAMWSGWEKVRRPASVLDALAALGLPARTPVARSLGGIEVAAGAAVVTVGGGAVLLANAVLWCGLLIAAWRLVQAGAASCGCFGRPGTTVGPAHLIVNGVAALACAVSAAGSAPSLADELRDAGAANAAMAIAVVVTTAYGAAALLTSTDPVAGGRP